MPTTHPAAVSAVLQLLQTAARHAGARYSLEPSPQTLADWRLAQAALAGETADREALQPRPVPVRTALMREARRMALVWVTGAPMDAQPHEAFAVWAPTSPLHHPRLHAALWQAWQSAAWLPSPRAASLPFVVEAI